MVPPCLRAAGLDDGPLERALAEDGGQRLRADINRARELDIFGAPSFVVKGELYWGNERLAAALERAWVD
ncbi:2-hydroxychromene-2-carboxylate isomerase, partial [Alcanivorax marinus]|nr:2-hydroxychromene-2-carboxylate isomerase [Alloalcanivorax marinus]